MRPDDAALRAGLVKTRRECLEVSERRYGREHSASMIARDNLAVALWRARQLDEARQLGQLGVDLVERSGFSHSVDRLWLLNTLANVLFDQGKVEESLARMGEAEEIGRRILPADSRELCDLRISRMNLLERAGRGDEAIAVLRSVLRLCDERLKRTDANEDRISRVDAGTDLGERLAKGGRWAEAVEVLSESMAIASKLRESSEARWTVTNALLETCRSWRAVDPAAPVESRIQAVEAALPALKAARR